MRKFLIIAAAIMSATVSSAQAEYEKIAITENVKQNSATRVIVQDSVTKVLNWVLKSSIAPVVPDATTISKGIVQLAGDLGGTASLPTTPTALHKTGNETFQGVKQAVNTSVSQSALSLNSDQTATIPALTVVNASTSNAGARFSTNVANATAAEIRQFGSGSTGMLIQPFQNNPEPTAKMLTLSNRLTVNGQVDTATPLTVLRNTVEVAKIDNLGNVTGLGANLTGETASTIASFDASKNVKSLPTATYPSLTELTYVKGVTSSIQTQLNGKQNTLPNPTTGTGSNNFLAKWAGTSTLASSMFYDNGTNTGVGTSNPLAKFVVSNSGVQGLEFGYDGTSNYLESVNRSTGLGVNMNYFIASIGGHRFYTDGVMRVMVASGGIVNIANLSGSMERIVTANAAGDLSASTAILSGSATLNFPNTPGQTSSELTISLTGAADGDCVSLGVGNSAAVSNGAYSCRVSAANTVTVKFNNYGLLAIDPPSGTFKVKVFK